MSRAGFSRGLSNSNLDPALRDTPGTVVSRLESIFESIVDSLSRNEDMHINIVAGSKRQRNPGDIR